MPNISSLFGSYQKAADLENTKTLTIRELKVEQIGQDKETKGVLYFEEEDEKPLPLNKTNADSIAEMFGGDWNNWPGHTIEIYPTKVPFGSKMVQGIRVRAPEGNSFVDDFVAGDEEKPKPKKADTVAPDLDDEINF
jgi:hypothetical protein